MPQARRRSVNFFTNAYICTRWNLVCIEPELFRLKVLAEHGRLATALLCLPLHGSRSCGGDIFLAEGDSVQFIELISFSKRCNLNPCKRKVTNWHPVSIGF